MRYMEHALRPDGTSRLDCYVQDTTIATGVTKTRPALIICPGGAYLTLASREGEPVAMRFSGLGYQTFVCRYLTYLEGKPLPGETPVIRENSHYPEQVIDLMRSIAHVRSHARAWCIDDQRVYIMGFSAGAHVCGLLAEHWDDPELLTLAGLTAEDADLVRPSGVVLCYPMLTARPKGIGTPNIVGAELLARAIFGTDTPNEELVDLFDLTRHVRPDMPRTYLWHTTEDSVVSPEDSVAFVGELLAQGIPCELHLYQRGPHGTSLCDEASASAPEHLNPAAAGWVEAAHIWMRDALAPTSS